MFGSTEPYDCSGSQAELGDQAARLTWTSAMRVAACHEFWLKSDIAEAVEGMREWARECGAWEADEIAAWSDDECMALFVQNVASELRMLGSDESTLEECARVYQGTDWEQKCEYPTGVYYLAADGAAHVEYYTGL
jgi:hypothetical protein